MRQAMYLKHGCHLLEYVPGDAQAGTNTHYLPRVGPIGTTLKCLAGLLTETRMRTVCALVHSLHAFPTTAA